MFLVAGGSWRGVFSLSMLSPRSPVLFPKPDFFCIIYALSALSSDYCINGKLRQVWLMIDVQPAQVGRDGI